MKNHFETTTAADEGRGELLSALIDDPQAGTREGEANVEESDGGADDGPLARMVAEFGAEIPPAVCADVLAWMAEQGLLVGSAKRQTGGAEEAKWRPLAAKALKILDYIKRHHKDSLVVYGALAAWDMPLFDVLNQNLSQQDFANTIIVRYKPTVEIVKGEHGDDLVTKMVPEYMTKAAVNNALKDAQKHFEIGPRKDQRDEDARDNMREKRIGQLAK